MRLLDNSPTNELAVSQLSRGLVNSRTIVNSPTENFINDRKIVIIFVQSET